jgi:hypothetical protein
MIVDVRRDYDIVFFRLLINRIILLIDIAWLIVLRILYGFRL